MAVMIGNVSFDLRLPGPELAPLAQEPEIVARPGLDGYLVQQQGRRSEPTPWALLSHESSNANADAKIAALRALRGTLVTVEDEYETQTEDVLVVDVPPALKRKVLVDGQERWRIEAIAVLLRTA